METRMDNELDIELSLLFEERTEDPCEHHAHEIDPNWHGGAGEWLVRSEPCPNCFGTKSVDLLFCDTFKRLVLDTRFPRICIRCGYVGSPGHTVLGRKGVDF